FQFSHLDGGRTGLLANARALLYPRDYGFRGCAKYEEGLEPFCSGNGAQLSFCATPWCYVDVEECRKVGVVVKRTERLRPLELYYSFAVCADGADAQAQTCTSPTKQVHNKTRHPKR
ncbi:hypothetical protein, partial [Mycobacterium sp.]|uniref:hypothetical protein n=1 Tax=Mycobacterium sp. TaxID=1785 RepID=UPI0025F78E9C